jgi:ADP-ribose pyrophosphatase
MQSGDVNRVNEGETIRGIEVVYRGRVFSVEVGERRLPDGSTHKVEIVRHAPSVVIIPVEPGGRVVIIRQFRAPLDREIWEFPAGRVNAGESPDEAARRECEEEIGRVPDHLERLGAPGGVSGPRGLYPAPGFCDEQLIFYRASGLRAPAPGSSCKPDEDENIEPRTVTLAEARTMVERGEIVDLKTAYALTLI